MRAVITVERHRSAPSSYLVGLPAVVILEGLPGISDVRLEEQGTHRAVLSYTWKDPGTHAASIDAALRGSGIRLV